MIKKLFSLLAIAMTAFAATAGHVTLDGTITSTKFYPGTIRPYQVYVPEQYTGDKPACLFLGLDGELCNAQAVMDSLITAGAMPVTIGVFLQHGMILDENDKALRYNRSNEYDMTDDRFGRFLETEVLPVIEGLTTPDGRHIRLSHDGNDHMMFGLSSGGICSFVTAWHRPDLFRRVFCGVGTFVPMRGGNDLQAIVRKHEPQPLRIFLQDGTNDVWNGTFGHWYEANRIMASALDFAGYDTGYDWSDCNHGVKRTNEIFADVMKWMWRDYPAPIKAGHTSNDMLAPLLPEDGPTEWVESKTTAARLSTDSVAARYPDGTVAVVRHKGTNCLWQYVIGKGGKLQYGQRFYWLHNYDNSQLEIGPMAFDAVGSLYVLTNAGIQMLDQNGRVRAIFNIPKVNIAQCASLTVKDGSIVIVTTKGQRWERRLNVKAPEKGKRPRSQGWG